MRLLRLLSVSIVALSMGLTGADAQSLRRDNGPAETPPASFEGMQYVDSRGCVYIRAGYSGNVTWVPRVTRSRNLICGQKPSLSASARAAKAAPTQRVARQRVNPQLGAAQPAAVSRCGASAFSSQFINEDARCGPQDGAARIAAIRADVSTQNRNPNLLVGPNSTPRKVAESRLPLPRGYKRAWNDGRLNPLRGVSRVSGQAQMQLIWSNTVPRYLIDPATGKRAKAK